MFRRPESNTSELLESVISGPGCQPAAILHPSSQIHFHWLQDSWTIATLNFLKLSFLVQTPKRKSPNLTAEAAEASWKETRPAAAASDSGLIVLFFPPSGPFVVAGPVRGRPGSRLQERTRFNAIKPTNNSHWLPPTPRRVVFHSSLPVRGGGQPGGRSLPSERLVSITETHVVFVLRSVADTNEQPATWKMDFSGSSFRQHFVTSLETGGIETGSESLDFNPSIRMTGRLLLPCWTLFVSRLADTNLSPG